MKRRDKQTAKLSSPKFTEADAAASPLLGPVVVYLTEVGGEDAAERIAEKYKIEYKAAALLVEVGWAKIRRAGICDIQRELGLAKKQNESLYGLAIKAGNLYAAQSARNELSKLLRLYDAVNLAAVDEAFQSETERLAREHLENLTITEQGLPLEELARRVALFVVNNITERDIDAATKRTTVSEKKGRQRKTQS